MTYEEFEINLVLLGCTKTKLAWKIGDISIRVFNGRQVYFYFDRAGSRWKNTYQEAIDYIIEGCPYE